MARARRPRNSWVLVLVGVISIGLTAGLIALYPSGPVLQTVIRAGALLGYLGVFLAILSSAFLRELVHYFGRPFIKVHHIVARAGVSMLFLHAVAVAWNVGSLRAFLPDFGSWRGFLELGGRPALWLIGVAVVAGFLRTVIGRNWRVIHWLNYIAFWLATVHGLLIGTDFRYLPVRVLSIAMAVIVAGVFVWKRRPRRRRA
jgi:hypothetical protein